VLVLRMINHSPWDIGRDQDGRYSNSEQVEVEWRIDRHLAIRAGHHGLMGKCVIVDSTVLVPKNDQQCPIAKNF